ncbi:MAG TPA: S-layer homology domain-containing protein [Sphingobacteriaceae bacterium]|nr:S-layer homology domain-containing protein [Sphingobacteriaceae bacterium]
MGAGAKSLLGALALWLLSAAVPGLPAVAYGASHPDMQGHWAEYPVTVLSVKGIVGGFPDGTFRPQEPVTRAQFVAMLAAAADLPLPPATVPQVFADVPPEHWAFQVVTAAWEAGIVQGMNDNRFLPDDPLTRAQLAVWLDRLTAGMLPSVPSGQEPPAGGEPDAPGQRDGVQVSFPDQDEIPAWAQEAVGRMVAAGLLQGMDDGSFHPARPANRGEAAVILTRLLGYLGLDYDLAGVVQENAVSASQLMVVNRTDGTLLAVPVTQETVYWRNGHPAGRDALQPDDEVAVVLSGGAAALVDAWNLSTGGTLLAVQADSRTLILQVGDGTVRNVQLRANTTISRNGSPAGLGALRAGDHIHATLSFFDGRARSVDALSIHAAGVIQRINVNQQWLRLQDVMGGTREIGWQASLRVNLDGAPSRVQYLRPGDKVYAALDQWGRAVYMEAYRDTPDRRQ